MMLKAWRWYQKCLAHHPVKTQVISSGVLWGIGDIAAQAITHCTLKNQPHKTSDEICCWLWYSGDEDGKYNYGLHGGPRNFLRGFQGDSSTEGGEEFKINWRRVAVTSMFGFGFVGPVGHFWYEGLDRYIRLRLQLQPKSLKFVSAKVASDALIFGPVDLFVFFTYMGLSAGKSVVQLKEDVKRDFVPAFILGGAVWPLVQVANFRFVPVRYQLLYVNVFCLLDSAFLSWLEQQEDAPWKQWFTSFLALEEKESQS